MSKPNRLGLTPFAEVNHRAMSGTRPVALHVSLELYGRMETCATAARFDLHEWLLRAVVSELLRPEAELVAERRARAAIAALPPGPPQPVRKT